MFNLKRKIRSSNLLNLANTTRTIYMIKPDKIKLSNSAVASLTEAVQQVKG